MERDCLTEANALPHGHCKKESRYLISTLIPKRREGNKKRPQRAEVFGIVLHIPDTGSLGVSRRGSLRHRDSYTFHQPIRCQTI